MFLPHKNKEIKASHLFNRFRVNEFVHYNKIEGVNGQLCYLSGCKLNNRKGKQDFLIIVSFNKSEKAQKDYKQRWHTSTTLSTAIEMCFKAMKSSGFDIENTHLQDIQRIEKLVLLFGVIKLASIYTKYYQYKLKNMVEKLKVFLNMDFLSL